VARLLTGDRCSAIEMQWSALRYQHTAAVRSMLMERYKPATANKILAALRRALQEAHRLGQMSAEDYARAADVPIVKSSGLLKGRALSSGEIIALMQACAADSSPAGARDAAIVAILYGCGLRRSELVTLDLVDLNVGSGGLIIRGGKGRKDREVYLPQGAIAAVADWVAVRGVDPGALLCPIGKTGRLDIRCLSDQAIPKILSKRAAAAGLQIDFSPHDFRRTFISDLFDRNVDVSTIQKLAGHSKPETSIRYDRRGEEAKRNAANQLHVPHFRRSQIP
jgi:integrase